tara:strand:- start:797 stop:1015 length:219 start_codon:yes stop_codon:yes gene_type:complete
LGIFIDYPMLKHVVAAVLIGSAVALQFVPLFRHAIHGWAARYPVIKIIQSRIFQLGAGFVLLTLGIELLRLK